MVVAVIPAERYAIDPESGVNLTVQYAAKHIVDSMNQLSLHGVALPSGLAEEMAFWRSTERCLIANACVSKS